MALAGVTQVQLAAAMGLTQSAISLIANGRTSVSVDLGWRLANYFGVSIEDLFPSREALAS